MDTESPFFPRNPGPGQVLGSTARPDGLIEWRRLLSERETTARELAATLQQVEEPTESGRWGFKRWLWVKNAYPKWNPDTWNQRLEPAVPWWVYFDPYGVNLTWSSLVDFTILWGFLSTNHLGGSDS